MTDIDYIDYWFPSIEHAGIYLTIFAKTMPADSNKAMMFYASKLEQGVATDDKPVEDTGTAKAPLLPIHLVNELDVKILRVLKEPDWLKTKNNTSLKYSKWAHRLERKLIPPMFSSK